MMHTLFQPENLTNSVFYPGCGYDLAPLVRYSDRISTFIYADWHEEEQEAPPKLQNAVAALNQPLDHSRLELAGEGTVLDRADVPGQPGLPPGFAFTDKEQKAYRSRLRQFGPFRPWGRVFTLNHIRPHAVDRLNLVYLRAEGLATYSALFERGNLAPRILVTIQSGPGFGFGFAKLEDPEGIMARFLTCCPAKPELWVRGTRGPRPPEACGPYAVPVEEYHQWHATVKEARVCAFGRAPISAADKN